MMIIPDSIEPVVGWKGLKIENGKLKSSVCNQTWEYDQSSIARCVSLGRLSHRYASFIMAGSKPVYEDDHIKTPAQSCTCGIYIAKTPAQAFCYGSGHTLVEVYGWGKVIPAEVGWRVEKCYPKTIYVLDEDKYTDELEKYGVPVYVIDKEYKDDIFISPIKIHPTTIWVTSSSPISISTDISSSTTTAMPLFNVSISTTGTNTTVTWEE